MLHEQSVGRRISLKYGEIQEDMGVEEREGNEEGKHELLLKIQGLGMSTRLLSRRQGCFLKLIVRKSVLSTSKLGCIVTLSRGLFVPEFKIRHDSLYNKTDIFLPEIFFCFVKI